MAFISAFQIKGGMRLEHAADRSNLLKYLFASVQVHPYPLCTVNRTVDNKSNHWEKALRAED